MKMPKKLSDSANRFLDYMETFSVVKRRIILATAAILIILAGVLVFVFCYKTHLELSDYLKVEFKGKNSSGTAEIVFDQEKFAKDILKYGKNLSRTPTKSDIKSMLKYKNSNVAESELDKMTSGLEKEQIADMVKDVSKLDIGVDLDIKDEDKMGYYMLGECYAYEVENELVELKNGDKLTITFTANNDIAKKYKIKLGTKKIMVTVSGLEE